MALKAEPTISWVPPRDLDLKAAQACLVAAFRRRVLEDYPDAEQETPGTRKAGWQRPLATAIDVSQAVISGLWREEPTDVQLSTLLKLQRYIDRPMDEILGIARRHEPGGPRDTYIGRSRR